uniref:Zf-AD domain-containing protein n=1 Tax=Gongylonema pulchrum TaxID=637853 RepID=A0A183EX54_9BILA
LEYLHVEYNTADLLRYTCLNCVEDMQQAIEMQLHAGTAKPDPSMSSYKEQVVFHSQNLGRKLEYLHVEYNTADLLRYTCLNCVEDMQQRVLHFWLLLLLSYFGSIDGFALMKKFLAKNVTEKTKLSELTIWLRPFATCTVMLKPALLAETFGPTLVSAFFCVSPCNSRHYQLRRIDHTSLCNCLPTSFYSWPILSDNCDASRMGSTFACKGSIWIK